MSKIKKNPHFDEVGYITSRPNELSDAYCVLYDAKQAGFDAKTGKWAIFCDAHGVILAHKNKRTATSLLRDPHRWCNVCRNTKELQEAARILTLRHERKDDEQIHMWAKLTKGNPEKIALFEDIYGVRPDDYWD